MFWIVLSVMWGLPVAAILVMMGELIKIQKKIEHRTEKPKNEKHWGWGKRK